MQYLHFLRKRYAFIIRWFCRRSNGKSQKVGSWSYFFRKNEGRFWIVDKGDAFLQDCVLPFQPVLVEQFKDSDQQARAFFDVPLHNAELTVQVLVLRPDNDFVFMDEEWFRQYNAFHLFKAEGQVKEIDFHFFHLVDLIFTLPIFYAQFSDKSNFRCHKRFSGVKICTSQKFEV